LVVEPYNEIKNTVRYLHVYLGQGDKARAFRVFVLPKGDTGDPWVASAVLQE